MGRGLMVRMTFCVPSRSVVPPGGTSYYSTQIEDWKLAKLSTNDPNNHHSFSTLASLLLKAHITPPDTWITMP